MTTQDCLHHQTDHLDYSMSWTNAEECDKRGWKTHAPQDQMERERNQSAEHRSPNVCTEKEIVLRKEKNKERESNQVEAKNDDDLK